MFVSLTGTSVAVVSALPKNSVGTAQLKANAIVSSKVKNGSLKAVDFASGQLLRGPQGNQGPTGQKGDKGDPGSTKVVLRSGTGLAAGMNYASNAEADCQPGEVATGGGAISNGTGWPVVMASTPLTASGSDVPTAWGAVIWNNGGPGTTETAVAYAICASP